MVIILNRVMISRNLRLLGSTGILGLFIPPQATFSTSIGLGLEIRENVLWSEMNFVAAYLYREGY